MSFNYAVAQNKEHLLEMLKRQSESALSNLIKFYTVKYKICKKYKKYIKICKNVAKCENLQKCKTYANFQVFPSR